MRELAYERKERDFEKAPGSLYDDHNFFEAYLSLQHAVNDYNDELCKERAKRRRDRREWEAACRERDTRVRKGATSCKPALALQREDKWHEAYLSVVGDQFGGRPASC